MTKTLTIMRHGDNMGELTLRGIAEIFNLAAQHKEAVPSVDVILHSNTTRTKETAQIMATEYEGVELRELPALQHFLPLVGLSEEWGSVVMVSHEPVLAQTFGYLMPGLRGAYYPHEGVAAVLEYPANSWDNLQETKSDGRFTVLDGRIDAKLDREKARALFGDLKHR